MEKAAKLFDFNEYISKRHVLGQVLPLPMPYTVQLFVANRCNYRCFYCIKSKPIAEQEDVGVQNNHMSFSIFQNVMDNIRRAGRVKLLIFQGWGEPLLNKDLVKMVDYAKRLEVADELRIITNGSVLTQQLSDQLIDAGLDSLKISLQGLTAESYQEIADVQMDYEQYVEQISYFFHHKRNTKVVVKIMDVMIPEDKDQETLQRIYAPICDEIMVEALIPFSKKVNYENHGSELNKSWLNREVLHSNICSQVFMRTTVTADGKVIPCHNLPAPIVLGDLLKESFQDVWNGKKHIQFLLQFLKNKKAEMPICNECKQYEHGLLSREILDDYRSELIEKYEAMERQ